MQVADAD